MILRKDAEAGRAGAASLPRGETFPLHQAPAKRDQAASDTESAQGCVRRHDGAQGELRSPPLLSRRGYDLHEASRGRTGARSMWSERRYRR